MKPEQFDVTLAGHERGDAFVYHIGLLMYDRLHNSETDACARAAWRAMEDGRCLLFQRRRAPGVCHYLAVRV